MRSLLDAAATTWRRAQKRSTAARATAELPLACAITRGRPILTGDAMAQAAGLARSTVTLRGGHREPVAGLETDQALTDLRTSSAGRRATTDTARGSVAEARAELAAVVAVARLFLTGDAIARRLGVSESTVSRLARSAPAPDIEPGWYPHPGRPGFERRFDGRRFTRTRPATKKAGG